MGLVIQHLPPVVDVLEVFHREFGHEAADPGDPAYVPDLLEGDQSLAHRDV